MRESSLRTAFSGSGNGSTSAPAGPWTGLAWIGQTVAMNLLIVHQRLYERSGGRIGHRLIGAPSALLRTTGRRSGQVRTSDFIYARDGRDYLLVASNNGSDRPPGYDGYQAKTSRKIPIVRVTPAARP